MIYNDFQGTKLSALGFGMMRLPIENGVYADVDGDQTETMVDYALEHGVNYFDTAWGYHDGNSEFAAGTSLSRHPRGSYHLATKFPGYDPTNFGKVEEIFERQLEKCRTDYFDFYLLHNIYERNVDSYLDDDTFGTISYLLEQKERGRIKHLGFSCHGAIDVLERFLDERGSDMEFCQIQLNYLDWNFQDAKAKVELLNERNIPIWVMEPVRGGKLVSLPKTDEARLREMRPDESVVAWAFRFLQTVPGVTVTLSGMSDLDQVKENIATFEEDKPLDKDEFDTIVGIADAMVSGGVLPCTACRYCTAHCPKGLDIPRILSLYNQYTFTGTGDFIAPMAIGAMPEDKRPSACIGCRSCEAVCPQQIKISEAMSAFAEALHL